MTLATRQRLNKIALLVWQTLGQLSVHVIFENVGSNLSGDNLNAASMS